jgi:hypothetical protein
MFDDKQKVGNLKPKVPHKKVRQIVEQSWFPNFNTNIWNFN